MDRLTATAKSSDGPEIIALPQLFNQTLNQPVGVPAGLLQLSLANLYGWVAYTIYDDFLDEEGRPQLLPAANVAMRYSLAAFRQARPKDSAFQTLVLRTFDQIDGANAWELNHCRFTVQDSRLEVGELPKYGDLQKLAERSLGHTLTPLAILLATGVTVDSSGFRQLQNALSHYLIARQLNDDSHDWQIDVQNGHISYVVTRILADAAITQGQIALADLLPVMQRQFWHQTLVVICQDMRQHTRLARRALKQVTGLRSDNVVSSLLDGIDASVNETLTAQQEAVSFLKHYAGNKQ